MLIVSGYLEVDPAERERYLDDCRAVVEQARGTAGCLDFALSADLIEAGRINVYERWESAEALAEFRGSGPSDDQAAAIRAADVREFTVR